MNNSAFFFQGDLLLLPSGVPDSAMDREIPLELAKEFEEPDIFEIPALGALPGSGIPAITAVSVLPGQPLPSGWQSVAVRQVLHRLKDEVGEGKGFQENVSLGRLLRACHIAQWRKDSRFCGSCGTRNIDAPGELARHCPACGRLEFPRISPAAIVIITNGKNEILLAHNKKFSPGVYSLIAGFNEPGESLEETAKREIREEVNIEVKDISYIRSQPWPFPNSLMLGFRAGYASGTIRPDGIEIEDAQWFTKDNLPQLPGAGSLSRYLINCWMEGTWEFKLHPEE